MSFGAPEWLALVPFLLFAAWRFEALRLRAPLRIACLSLLLVALAEPSLGRGGRGLDVWLLVDRSASARDLVAPRRAEVEALLERSRGRGDTLHVVDFAEEAALRDESRGWTPRGAETRLGSAMRFALSRMKPGRSSRLLLLTDGFSTEPLFGLPETLRAQGVAVDLRRLAHERARDYRVESVALPARALAGEPFVIEAVVTGEPDGAVPVTVFRDDRPVGKGTAQVADGRATVRFTDALGAGGAFRYSVQVEGEGDPVRGNDREESWIEVGGGPRALLVTSHRDHPLAAALQAQGFAVDAVTDPRRLTVGRLTGARLLVVDDVPAHVLPADFLAAIDGYVRLQGGGFLMTGGRQAFGSGGYFGSPVDSVLPVSMELKQEHRKLAVAMAIVLDRSGSMAASVGGRLTKMDLANAGAARSVELLGENDGITVFAVDSDPHRVVPLSSLGRSRGPVVDVIRRVQSAGGGIFVYTGLAAAWKELKDAPYGQRHVILFADAADAEEPGEYQRLLEEMTKAGATVSVIGLGSEADSDAAFLQDVAARGKGRMFFSLDPASLPAVFAQETVSVARSAFIEERTGARSGAGWLELAGRPLRFPEAVDGYNLCYLRPEATAALATTDEYDAPLVAFWHRGAGRAMAVTFPVAGEHSAAVRAWPEYGDFAQTLGRWLAAQELPAGIGLRARREGTHLVAELLFDESWEERLAAAPPRVAVAEGLSAEVRDLTWERIEPGRFRARTPMRPGAWYRGAARVGGQTIPFGPIGSPESAEWTMDARRLRELEALVASTGGQDRNDLASIWSAPRPNRTATDLRPFALLAALALFLGEALRGRLKPASATRAPARATDAAAPSAAIEEPPAAPAPAVLDDAERRRRRYGEAKRGR
jgi:hypothetical protein